MIRKLSVKRFKCLRDVNVPLGPFNVLVGPNDSGKTSILEAIYCLGQTLKRPLVTRGTVATAPADDPWFRPGLHHRGFPGTPIFAGDWALDRICWRDSKDPMMLRVEGKTDIAFEYTLGLLPVQENSGPPVIDTEVLMWGNDDLLRVDRGQGTILVRGKLRGDPNQLATSALFSELANLGSDGSAIRDAFLTTEPLRWDPRMLGLAAPVHLDGGMRPDGFGLVSELSSLRDRLGAKGWLELEHSLCQQAPTVAGIHFATTRMAYGGEKRDGWILEIMPGGNDRPVPASQVSDGVLMTLAFLALVRRPDPPSIILIEEPEAGLHPRRIHAIVDLLRHLPQSGVGPTPPQVILTTHSPLVLNCVAPEEALLVTRDPISGTKVIPFTASGAVEAAREAFDLGELWYNVGDEPIARQAK